jgi:hypothetical protein
MKKEGRWLLKPTGSFHGTGQGREDTDTKADGFLSADYR